MSWFNLENLRKTSIYITPNFPSLQTKRYKVKFFRLLLLMGVFAFSLFMLAAIIFTFTPAKKVLLFLENEKLAEHATEIKQLEEKIILLTDEIAQISEINKRLKYAITLARTDSLDSTAFIYDSLRQFKEMGSNLDGSIYNVFMRLISPAESKSDSDKNIYFISPSNGVVIKKFLPDENHIGIDYGIKKNSPVYASGSGVVISAHYSVDNGYTIILQHDENFITKYKHLGEILVDERESVKAGQIIALSGNSGRNTTGPHLHFEIWKRDKPINPLKLLAN